MAYTHLLKAWGCLAERTRTRKKGSGRVRASCASQARLTPSPLPVTSANSLHLQSPGKELYAIFPGRREVGEETGTSRGSYFPYRCQEPELIIISTLQMMKWRSRVRMRLSQDPMTSR